MKLTTSHVIRWAGLAALIAGIIFAVIQPIHPQDELSSVNTDAWAVIQPVKVVMGLLFLFGLTGLYARQAHKAGWIGLAGYLLFSVSWAMNLAFIFAEAFFLPVLATEAPRFVESALTLANGSAREINIGALPTIYGLSGFFGYMLGGLLFGIATYRANVLPRWPAALLALAALITPVGALLPHATQRLVGMPVGLAMAWLGFALWSERRARAAERLPDMVSPQLYPGGAQ